MNLVFRMFLKKLIPYNDAYFNSMIRVSSDWRSCLWNDQIFHNFIFNPNRDFYFLIHKIIGIKGLNDFAWIGTFEKQNSR